MGAGFLYMFQCLETARTILRPFQENDRDAAFNWFSDQEVMKHIPLGADQTPDQTAARIGRYMDHQNRHGFSKWIILDRVSGVPMGDAGLFHLPDGARVELGYRFARPWWGRGLATEVGARWLEAARDWFGMETVYAFAHAENKASLHVIEKLGFTFSRTETFYGMEAPLYAVKPRANKPR